MVIADVLVILLLVVVDVLVLARVITLVIVVEIVVTVVEVTAAVLDTVIVLVGGVVNLPGGLARIRGGGGRVVLVACNVSVPCILLVCEDLVVERQPLCPQISVVLKGDEVLRLSRDVAFLCGAVRGGGVPLLGLSGLVREPIVIVSRGGGVPRLVLTGLVIAVDLGGEEPMVLAGLVLVAAFRVVVESPLDFVRRPSAWALRA